MADRVDIAVNYAPKGVVLIGVRRRKGHAAIKVWDTGDGMPTGLRLSCNCLLYTSPSPRDLSTSRMPSSA